VWRILRGLDMMMSRNVCEKRVEKKPQISRRWCWLLGAKLAAHRQFVNLYLGIILDEGTIDDELEMKSMSSLKMIILFSKIFPMRNWR
jgi:hypothetical protein